MSVPLGRALGAVALGGMAGASIRWAAQEAWTGDLWWVTVAINVVGCFLIGLLTVWVARRGAELVRLFLGVGALGGFTTFSAYAVDVQQLLVEGRTATAAAVLFGTLVAALLAVAAGTALGDRVLGRVD